MKNYLIPIILFVIGLAAKLTYIAIASEITADGILVEPFGLLAVGNLLLLLSLLTSAFVFSFSWLKKEKNG